MLWEASDRVCGRQLKPLLHILLPALERHGNLKLDEAIRTKVLAMSAATIDRLLRAPRNATRTRKPRRVTPEIRRRVAIRTFADWNDPPPGSIEMDLVAHCGDLNRGSYVHSLVLTDIASGWTECAPPSRARKYIARGSTGARASGIAVYISNARRRWQRVRERDDDPVLPCAMASSSPARGRIARMTKPGLNRRTARSCASSWVIVGSKGSLRHRCSRVCMGHHGCS